MIVSWLAPVALALVLFACGFAVGVRYARVVLGAAAARAIDETRRALGAKLQEAHAPKILTHYRDGVVTGKEIVYPDGRIVKLAAGEDVKKETYR